MRGQLCYLCHSSPSLMKQQQPYAPFRPSLPIVQPAPAPAPQQKEEAKLPHSTPAPYYLTQPPKDGSYTEG